MQRVQNISLLSIWRLLISDTRRIVVFLTGFLLTLLIVFIAGLAPRGRVPVVALELVSEQIGRIFYDRQVQLPENLEPFASVIRSKLPWERSNIFWNVSADALQEKLNHIPLLLEPELKRCSTFSLRCFELAADIREPHVVAKLERDWWLVAQDGTFLIPIDDPSRVNRANGRYPEVTGLAAYSSSPERLREAASQMLLAINIFENEAEVSVKRIDLRSAERLQLSFQNSDTEVVLNPQDLASSTLVESAKRIRSILTLENQHRLSPEAWKGRRISEVDLRYKGLAVARREALGSQDTDIRQQS